MLENFKEIYDEELENEFRYFPFKKMIFNSTEARQFVYELCKRLTPPEPSVEADTGLEDL